MKLSGQDVAKLIGLIVLFSCISLVVLYVAAAVAVSVLDNIWGLLVGPVVAAVLALVALFIYKQRRNGGPST